MSFVLREIVEQASRAMGLSLSANEIDAFARYAAELKKWNSKVNLTAITDDNEIAIKHFIDSLTIAPFITADDRLLDIGSGAGLPAIPLKIISPDIPIVSVDAVAKKIHFQRHVIRILNLANIEALHTRVEDLCKTHSHSFTVIVSRAFTRLDHFVALAEPLLAENGVLIAMKGEGTDGEIASSDAALAACGFTITSVHHYSLPKGMGNRVLLLIKRSKTP